PTREGRQAVSRPTRRDTNPKSLTNWQKCQAKPDKKRPMV
ncbi:unnamed protein product, partial [marine sediment metagenome]